MKTLRRTLIGLLAAITLSTSISAPAQAAMPPNALSVSLIRMTMPVMNLIQHLVGEEPKAEPAAPDHDEHAGLDCRYIKFPGRAEPIDISAVIVREADKQGVDPRLIETIIKHESNFEPTAMSGVGASGLMQLMPETAAELGVTDITDPEQNIAAGTKYFAQMLRHYGDVRVALAAYNAGPGNVDYYGGIPPFAETRNYARSIAREYEERLN